MRAAAVFLALMMGLGVFIFFLASYMPQSGQTITHYTTIVREVTTTTTKTTLAIKTAGPSYSSLPANMMLRLVNMVPDYQNVETYHIWVPDKPGVYLYKFAVFWKFGENHTHIVVFHPPENRRFIFRPDSLIQVRFAAAKNIPNTPSPITPTALIVENVLTEDETVYSKSWEINPPLQGIPSQPQQASGGHQLWIVQYTPLELKNYGESLVARYYFLEMQVIS